MKAAHSLVVALVSLGLLAFASASNAEVCPATNVVGTIQWVATPTRAVVQPAGESCVASIKLKRAVPAPGIPSTVHFMKNGHVVKSVAMDIKGTVNEPVVIEGASDTQFDSLVVMANFN
jgi:hypothetical protein